MQTVGSVASVVAAIREDAAAEAERIEQTIAADVAAIRREEETAIIAIADREIRLAAARRENRERIAQLEWEGKRAVMEQREEWISRVVAKAGEQWKCTAEELNAFVREALQNVAATECEVTVAARDRHLIDPTKFERKIRIATAAIDGGCLVTAGETVFDNTFGARSARLEAEWRKALSEVYRP
ncbi:MAG TPA: V-type ATP synthase subunit E [Thermoanaerobaculia bacterium]|nr:V-type ATP synthase subunit E [Thermoanaerobaculia bacterium]